MDDGRVYLVVNLDESLVGRGLDASKLVRELGKHIEGGGGGRPTLGEAGGKNPAGLRERTGSREASDRCSAEVKVLALDYGRARTGVAVSDPTGTIARPLCVVEEAATGDGLARLATLIGEHEVDRVVVGLPLTLRGDRGEQARETERFVEALSDVDQRSGRSRSTNASRPTSRNRHHPTHRKTHGQRHIFCPAT